MDQASIERLRNYLAQLPPKSQALLMREFERAVERGEDAAVATFVLEELRRIARRSDDSERARSDDPARHLFRPLEPFLVEGGSAMRPGQIRRTSLMPVWQWLGQDGAPDAVRVFEAVLATQAGSASGIEAAARTFQAAAAAAIQRIFADGVDPDRQRALGRIGGPGVVEDLAAIGAVLNAREALDTLNGRLPGFLRIFGEAQIAALMTALNVPSLQTPLALPFALSLVMQRLSASWQIIRLAIRIAGSDDEIRVAATPYGVAVTLALDDLSRTSAGLRADIRRGRFENVSEHLKIVHDGVRGLRTELDIRADSSWGRQLAAIRVDISNGLQSEIDGVSGRVRRLLRQRPDKDIPPGARLDPIEVEETAALIDFVAVCRTYASELAINEVTMRTYSDLQHYVERTAETLVESLRNGDERVRAFRQQQVKAAIRFCEVLFGQDYSSLMSRAADNALTAERKSSRAG
ncbi:conserved hypothetical protein [Nitrobacter hamburgensis X14]|uniref:Uncharacterized protein n=1 Tax=Nitrobacter hamburgensis (strain DSM 10229 / NCIMB 13809 / X14) TaxID=323097 RepID=Q1QND9_NITHX|nr:hypothetical protein [Nitrobacter hamburgensis]ABE62258.1 conserved hypothetical protein [Nitrobacter hamburgensis X14]